jgi:predicted ArsR family transcriptional regulator
VLAALRDQERPASPAGLGRTTGLHPNTLREHLDTLVEEGLARKERAAPHGRGRPAWLYSARRPGGAVTEYAGLATTLADVIARTSSRPWEDAVDAGTGWGRALAAAGPPVADHARRRVVALLEDLRFAPETDDEVTVRLTRCPLLDAAQAHPDVVCGVHLGLVRGALDQLGEDSAGTSLHPFAEPGACLLRLDRRSAS